MALKVGDKAPDFLLADTEKELRSLKEFLGNKTLITFYPAAFTSVCTKQVCNIRDSIAALGDLSVQVVGISVDPVDSLKAFAAKNNIAFPLLSDFTRHVSALYAGLYVGLGGIPGYTAAKRSAFVLDGQGVVRYAWISENPGAEPDYNEVKAALSSF